MCRNMLSLLALASVIAGACTDRPLALAPDESLTAAPTAGAPTDPREALARTLALALRSPVLRAYLRVKLQASPFREQKLLFQRFLYGDGQHALMRIAAETATPAAAVAGMTNAAIPLELYLPVPGHRAAWIGDGRVLVATGVSDGDTPVAYDTAGNRYLLSATTPPAIPVLALVPVETDFSTPPSAMLCLSDCGGGGGPPPAPPAPAPGLYMTQAHFTQTLRDAWNPSNDGLIGRCRGNCRGRLRCHSCQSLYGSNSLAPAMTTMTGVSVCRIRTVSPCAARTSGSLR